jgi:phosphatidylglycerophosphatase A
LPAKFLTIFGLGLMGIPGIIVALLIPGLLSILLPDEYRFVSLLSLSVLLVIISIKPILSIDLNQVKGSILIDKVSSYLLVLSFCPFADEWIWMLISFAVFIMFDQMKLFPHRFISGKPGLIGVFGDDMIAGIYTIMTMYLFYSAFQVIGLMKILGM